MAWFRKLPPQKAWLTPSSHKSYSTHGQSNQEQAKALNKSRWYVALMRKLFARINANQHSKTRRQTRMQQTNQVVRGTNAHVHAHEHAINIGKYQQLFKFDYTIFYTLSLRNRYMD